MSTGFLEREVARTYRRERITSLCDWASEHVPLPGSVKSNRFDATITPWTRFAIEACLHPWTRVLTFIKPVQTGGSVVGEILLCHLLANETGDIFYNWEDDLKARERWDKRVEPMLRACKVIPGSYNRTSKQKCLYVLPRGNLTVQGVQSESNLASDSIRFLINEEVHSWPAGRLKMAYNRTRACWNSLIVNISNASLKGDQLHQAWEASQQRHIEVKCPGCGKYHEMHTRWMDKRPELGGLRYDADGARFENGRYSYRRIAETLRYQMPCGREIPDNREARRSLALSCRAGEPKNPGADISHPGFTYDSVLCDDIPWIDLVRSKHEALFARELGNPEPWRVYLNEIECVFYDGNEAPLVGRIVVSSGPKNRKGMEHRAFRMAAGDRQKGEKSKGELSHWWMVIWDIDKDGNVLIVYEGKLDNDDDVNGVIKSHEVKPSHCVFDSGFDTTHVYQFCLKNGYHAIKGGSQRTAFFMHEDGGRRIYGPEKPLHLMLNSAPKYDYEMFHGEEIPHPDEPMFWLYSAFGIRERFDWLCANRKFDVPSDVSEDFLEHLEAEELKTKRNAMTGQVERYYHPVRDRFDLRVCCCYLTMMADKAGIIGGVIPDDGETNLVETETV